MKEVQSLLIVDDDARFAETLALEFQERGWRVDSVADLEGLRALPPFAHRYAVVDLRLRHQNGLDALPLILERSPRARIVVLTGYGSIATALEAMRLGATHYLTKPADVEEILAAFGRGKASGPPPESPAAAAVEIPSLARVEWEHINRVLADCEGNVSKAARALGIHRRSLQRKLSRFPSSR
jgi:two-component system, response regulator RegA